MQMLSQNLPSILTLPIILIVCFACLFYYLSWTFSIGTGVFFIAVYVNMSISRYMARLGKKYMKKQDGRMSAITETLNNIKMLKLYSWVEIFRDKITEKRKEEISVSWTRALLFCCVIATYNFFPIFIQAVSLFSYVAFGFTIDLATVFTLITLFSLLAGPVRTLPWFMGQMIEFHVSMRRIQRFLLCPEVNLNMIDDSGIGAPAHA